MQKVFKRIRRIRQKNLCVHGENTERLLDIRRKLSISRLIMVQHEHFV
jgi:hypothetical protein